MPVNITDADAFTTPVVVAANGEAANQTEKVLTAQALANRTLYLATRTPGAVAGQRVAIPLVAVANTSARWTFDSAQMQWDQTDVTSAGALVFPLVLPVACDIVSVRLRLLGSHATAPAGLPAVTVYSNDGAGGGSASEGTATHPGTGYDVLATLTATVASGAYDPALAKRWYVEVTGESGANSATGLLLLSLDVEVNPS